MHIILGNTTQANEVKAVIRSLRQLRADTTKLHVLLESFDQIDEASELAGLLGMESTGTDAEGNPTYNVAEMVSLKNMIASLNATLQAQGDILSLQREVI